MGDAPSAAAAPETRPYGGKRPDVFAAFPGLSGTEFPDPKSLYSGFVANLDTTQLLDGMHTITVRATDNQGAARDIGSVSIRVAEQQRRARSLRTARVSDWTRRR